MDYNALQHKLFAMDPTDPKEDLAKLRSQIGGDAPVSAPAIDYIAESAVVPEGSLQMDQNLSVNDFATLAGVNFMKIILDMMNNDDIYIEEPKEITVLRYYEEVVVK